MSDGDHGYLRSSLAAALEAVPRSRKYTMKLLRTEKFPPIRLTKSRFISLAIYHRFDATAQVVDDACVSGFLLSEFEGILQVARSSRLDHQLHGFQVFINYSLLQRIFNSSIGHVQLKQVSGDFQVSALYRGFLQSIVHARSSQLYQSVDHRNGWCATLSARSRQESAIQGPRSQLVE